MRMRMMMIEQWVLTQYSLEPNEYTIVETIKFMSYKYECGYCHKTIEEIVEHTGISPIKGKRIIAKLLKKGFLIQEPNKDGLKACDIFENLNRI
jgi:DNA-binding MarR family transcriptional regulator